MWLHPLKQPGERPTMIRAEAFDFPEGLARSSILRLGGMSCRPHRGAHDFNMRTASAQIIAQRLEHLGFGRVRATLEQRLGGHDHAIETVAALRRLRSDEGFLHRIGLAARAKPLKRQNVALDTAA